MYKNILTLTAIVLLFSTFSVVRAASYRISNPGDSVTVTCRANDPNYCGYSGIVVFINDSSQMLFENVTWVDDPVNIMTYSGPNGWTNTRQNVTQSVIEPGGGLSIGVDVKNPKKVGNYYVRLYIDGKTCNRNVTPWDCYYYGGKAFTVNMIVTDDPTATPVPPTSTVVPPTSTPTSPPKAPSCSAFSCDLNGDGVMSYENDYPFFQSCFKSEAVSSACKSNDVNGSVYGQCDGYVTVLDFSYIKAKCWSTTPTPTNVATNTPSPTPTQSASGGNNNNQNTNSSTGGTSSSPAPVCSKDKPNAPKGLSLTWANTNVVKISWTKVPKATHYTISYGVKSGEYIYGVPNTGDTNNYLVESLVKNGKYFFVVQAVNDCAPSDRSSEVSTFGTVVVTPEPTEKPNKDSGILGVIEKKISNKDSKSTVIGLDNKSQKADSPNMVYYVVGSVMSILTLAIMALVIMKKKAFILTKYQMLKDVIMAKIMTIRSLVKSRA